jgi:hypothetical protein
MALEGLVRGVNGIQFTLQAGDSDESGYIVRIAVIGNLLVWKIMSLGPLGNTGFQSALDGITRL